MAYIENKNIITKKKITILYKDIKIKLTCVLVEINYVIIDENFKTKARTSDNVFFL